MFNVRGSGAIFTVRGARFKVRCYLIGNLEPRTLNYEKGTLNLEL